MISGSTFRCVHCRSAVDIGSWGLSIVTAVRRSTLLLSTSILNITIWSCSSSIKLRTFCLHQTSNCFRIIYNKVINVIVIHYVCDILSFWRRWRTSHRTSICLWLARLTRIIWLRIAQSNIFIFIFKLNRIILNYKVVASFYNRLFWLSNGLFGNFYREVLLIVLSLLLFCWHHWSNFLLLLLLSFWSYLAPLSINILQNNFTLTSIFLIFNKCWWSISFIF